MCEQCEKKGLQKQHSFIKIANDKETAKNVFCDSCNNSIAGKRYKCTVCSDYDLCEECEKKNVHSEHLLVRYSEKADKLGDEPLIHEGVFCNYCDGPVIGTRHKCSTCFDYDLCDKCERKGVHKEHGLFKVPHPSRLSNMVTTSLKSATTNSFHHFLNNFRIFANNHKMAYNDFYTKTFKNQQYISAAPYLANNLCLTNASAATKRLCSLMNDNPNYPDPRSTSILSPVLTTNFEKMKISTYATGGARNPGTGLKSKETKKLDEFIEDSDYEAFVKSFADIESDEDNDLIERDLGLFNDGGKGHDDKFFSNFLKSDTSNKRNISNKN